MFDPVLRDSRIAAWLFFAATISLLTGALLGMNAWPAQRIADAAFNGSGKDLFIAVHGYGLVICALFWGSRPSIRSQKVVLIGWVAATIALAALLEGQIELTWSDGRGFPYPMFLGTTLAIPCLVALTWRVSRINDSGPDGEIALRLRWLLVLSLLFMLVPQPALTLTATLHPNTFDLIALHFDRAAGLAIAPQVVAAVDAVPGLSSLVHLCYGLTPLGFLAVALLHLRGKPPHVASALLTWVVLTACAILAYNLFPITGPKYVFGSAGYVTALNPSTSQAVDLVKVNPYPRNGMPSMHFGWLLAASILWWRSGTRYWTRGIIIAMASITAVATLYNGEHYLIDLLVAVPFVLAAIALCSTGIPWSAPERWQSILYGFGAWLVWVLLLRTQITAFIENPWLCWLLIGATAVVVVAQARWISRFSALPLTLPAAEMAPAEAATRAWHRRFGAMFFVSGAAALVYQVLFAKQLALVFGSTATATLTVLATFLGGMAIGSLIGGWLAQRVVKPLAAYAFIELAIAVYCVATPQLFSGIQSAYVAFASGMPPDTPSLLVLRVVLGAGVLLVPTILMGTTLPLLAQALGPDAGRMGSRVALLYFANTAGAAVGALTTAYFVIPSLGAHRTTLIAALLNLLVALGALEIAKKVGSTVVQALTNADEIPASGRPVTRGLRRAALIALGVSGALSLGLEVVYVHLLSIVAGNSVYAFGLMLATFLIGLSVGGECARRILSIPTSDAPTALALSLLGLAACVGLGSTLWNGIPEYFASFANYPAAREFGSREAIRGLVCALVMIPPTLFIGAAYVFGMDVVTSSNEVPKARSLGTGAAVNTIGNIVGVLLFGFVLLPAIGGLDSSRLIAGLATVLGLALLLQARPKSWRPAAMAALAAPVLASAALRVELDYNLLSSGANVYFYPQRWGKIVAHAESIDGGLTAVAQGDSPQGPVRTLLTNGKFQGNDALGGEMQAQIGFAFAPLLHQPKRDRALVIGYGTGVTSRVFHDAGFKHVDIAELSSDIVQMADTHFPLVNNRVSTAPGVQLHVTDGRNLLLLSRDQYDVISIEITSIWFAGAASLYNREFYALAKSRLSTGGVLQQWMQIHRLNPTDLLQIVTTLRSEFRYVSLYMIGSQGILVATDDANAAMANKPAVERLRNDASLAKIRELAGRDPGDITADLLLKPSSVDQFINEFGVDPSVWISTDDNLRLEYSTPRANVNDAQKSFKANLSLLKSFR